MPLSPKSADILIALNQVTDVDELRTLNTAVIDRIREVQRIQLQGMKASGQIRPGVRVSFVSAKLGGQRVFGVVDKINQKTVSLTTEVSMTGYRVPVTMLQIEPAVVAKSALPWGRAWIAPSLLS